MKDFLTGSMYRECAEVAEQLLKNDPSFKVLVFVLMAYHPLTSQFQASNPNLNTFSLPYKLP